MSFQLGHEVEHAQHVHIPGRGGRSQGDFHNYTIKGGGYWGTLWLEGGMESRRVHLMVPSKACQRPLLWREQFIIFLQWHPRPNRGGKTWTNKKPKQTPTLRAFVGDLSGKPMSLWVLCSGNEAERFAVRTLWQSPARVKTSKTLISCLGQKRSYTIKSCLPTCHPILCSTAVERAYPKCSILI